METVAGLNDSRLGLPLSEAQTLKLKVRPASKVILPSTRRAPEIKLFKLID